MGHFDANYLEIHFWKYTFENTLLKIHFGNLKAVGHRFQKIYHVLWSTDALLHWHSGHLKVWPTYPSSHWGRFQRCSRLKKYQTASKSLQWRTGSVGWYRVDIGLPRGHLARNDDKFTHFLPQLSFVGDIFAIWSQLSHLFLTTLLRPVLRLDFFNTIYLGKKQTHINSLLLMSSFLQEFKKTKFFFL